MRAVATWMGVVLLVPGCGELFTATADYTLTDEWPANAALIIDWSAGDIDVVVDTTATGITASGTKRVRATSAEEADLLLPGLDVQLTVSATDSAVRVLQLDRPNVTSLAQFSADVTVTLPRGSVLNIVQGSGDIAVRDNAQATVIRAGNGDIDVTGLTDADADITLANGAVTLDSTGGNVIVQVTNGQVGINAAPPADGGVAVTGVNLGFVGVAVPRTFSGIIALEATNGVIQAFLEQFDQFDAAAVGTTPTSVTATLGTGGGRVDVSVVSGNITVQPL